MAPLSIASADHYIAFGEHLFPLDESLMLRIRFRAVGIQVGGVDRIEETTVALA